MSSKITVFQVDGHHRSRVVCEAMFNGIKACGENVELKFENQYNGVESDIAVFYGLEGNLGRIFRDYSRKARAVYIDLGYWGRREGGRWSGYHKVVVNSRHPESYFQSTVHSADRFNRFGLRVEDWKWSGKHILIAGMGDKGARAEGYAPQEWETWAINELRKYTKRALLYRPKPSWREAKPLAYAGYSKETPAQDKEKGLKKALVDCYAVVTHHSNVAVDALVQGIPTFCWKGVAACMSSQDLSTIESPHYPEGRQQWCNDIAHTQWSIREMSQGHAWKYLKNEVLHLAKEILQ